MPKNKENQDEGGQKVDLTEAWTNSRLTVFLQSTAITVVLITALAGGGYYLDQFIGTSPTFFIIGIVAGFPITQFYIYKKFKKFSENKVRE